MPGSPRRHPRPARLATVVMASLLLVGAVSCSKTSNGDNSSKDTSTHVGDGTSIVRTSSTTSTTRKVTKTTFTTTISSTSTVTNTLFLGAFTTSGTLTTTETIGSVYRFTVSTTVTKSRCAHQC